MRLFGITNTFYFIAFGLSFLLLSVISYSVIRHVIDREFNEKLHAEKRQFIEELDLYDELKEVLYLNIGDIITLVPQDPASTLPEVLRDTTMFDARQNKMITYREISFTTMHNETYYRVSIFKSLVSNELLLEAIVEIIFTAIFLFIALLLLLNTLLFRRIWNPFYETLKALKAFDVKRPRSLALSMPKVREFAELNQVVNTITSQSSSDYQTLKEYTENASHEIQTPLMVIQNETELLIQEPLTPNQVKHVQQIKMSAMRLSKLKEGLAIFSKIENHQFVATTPIQVEPYLRQLLDNVADLVEMKNIHIDWVISNEVTVLMHETLTYLLFNNLINNALKYNFHNGYIKVLLTSEFLELENIGEALVVPPEQLFQRFQRGGSKTDGTGLGLSIIRKIAEYYHMKVSYENIASVHRIRLWFSP